MDNTTKFSKRAWFIGKELTRKDITYMNRIKSGHMQLNQLLQRMHIVNSAACECGEAQESIEHVVWFCPFYDQDRSELLSTLEKENIPLYSSIADIFLTRKLDVLKKLLNFLYQNAVFL